SYEVGVEQRSPVPRFGDVERHRLKEVGRVFEIRRSLDTTNEVSHVFCLPAILRVSGTTLTSRSETWRCENDKRLAEVSSLTASINDTVTNLYGLEPVDLSRWRNGENLSLIDEDSDPDEQEEKFESDHDDQGNPREYVSALLSYNFGAIFGRWDIRLATGQRPMPELPDPFTPLPVCSPGM